jgi:XRE family aerobic/anaerobic benzoate catabolism transcriptional regulator
MPNIANKIKKLRESAGLSSKDLAENSGLSPAYISKIESGSTLSISLTTSKKIAYGLGLSLKDFLSELGFINNTERPSFEMITNAFRSKGYTPEQVQQIIKYAEFIKE